MAVTMLKCPVTTSHLKCWYHPDPQPPWSLHHQPSTGPRCLQSPRPPARPQSRGQSPRPHPVSLPSQPALTAHVCARLRTPAQVCAHLHTSAHITSAHISSHVCTRLLTSVCICSRLHTSSHICSDLHMSAHICTNLCTSAHICTGLLTSAHICSHLHTSALVCACVLTSAHICTRLLNLPRLSSNVCSSLLWDNICKVRLSSCCSSNESSPDLECLWAAHFSGERDQIGWQTNIWHLLLPLVHHRHETDGKPETFMKHFYSLILFLWLH